MSNAFTPNSVIHIPMKSGIFLRSLAATAVPKIAKTGNNKVNNMLIESGKEYISFNMLGTHVVSPSFVRFVIIANIANTAIETVRVLSTPRLLLSFACNCG